MMRFESKKSRVQISVDPKHFNEHDMTALVGRLSAELCHDTDVEVAISDDYEAAKSPDLIPDMMRNTPNPALRGACLINGRNGKSSVTFSTKRGTRLDEIHLEFDNEPRKR
jgi:hypothetical protein